MVLDDLAGDLDYPMTIVTAVAAGTGERSGCLVGFHTQCSIDPVRWAVWISKANHTYGVAVDAEVLAVHFPGTRDHDVAELFGSLTDDAVDKFERCEWTTGPGGVPLLDRLPNRFVGRVVDVVDDGGDHVCFVLEPVVSAHPRPVDQLGFQSTRDIEPGHPA